MANILSFSHGQQRALTQFFSPDNICPDWNALSEQDPMWGQCVDVMEARYPQNPQDDDALAQRIKQVAREAFSAMRKSDNIKRFFQEHLLTSLDDMEKSYKQFVEETRINQYRHYICLMPSQPGSLVEERLLVNSLSFLANGESMIITLENVLSRLKDRVKRVDRFDFLLDNNLQSPPSWGRELPGGGFSVGRSSICLFGSQVDIISEPCVALPQNEHSERSDRMGNAIRTVMKTKFLEQEGCCVVS